MSSPWVTYNASYTGAPQNRGYTQPKQTKQETPKEAKRRKQREAVEDIKKYKQALNEAKERYQAYDSPEEVHDGGISKESCKRIPKE